MFFHPTANCNRIEFYENALSIRYLMLHDPAIKYEILIVRTHFWFGCSLIEVELTKQRPIRHRLLKKHPSFKAFAKYKQYLISLF